MSSKESINKEILEHLAELGRIEISDKRQATSDKEEKLLKDLQEILAYFNELEEVDTENVEPMAGGTIGMNVLREDIKSSKFSAKGGFVSVGKVQSSKLAEAFPEKENGFLKVPAVFSAEGGSPPEANAPLERASGGE